MQAAVLRGRRFFIGGVVGDARTEGFAYSVLGGWIDMSLDLRQVCKRYKLMNS